MKAIDRFFQYIEYKGIKPTRFEKDVGFSNGYLGTQFRRKGNLGEDVLNIIIDNCLDINPEWLLSGNGEMIKSNYAQNGELKVVAEPEINYSNEKPIPLIPLDAMAGFGTTETTILELECEKFVVPTFKGCDFLIQVRGISMQPKYNSGDIVACKKLAAPDVFFQWGKVYVLDTDQGALIKRVKKGKDDTHILVVSDNPEYDPFELHLSKLNAIAIVMGIIRLV